MAKDWSESDASTSSAGLTFWSTERVYLNPKQFTGLTNSTAVLLSGVPASLFGSGVRLDSPLGGPWVWDLASTTPGTGRSLLFCFMLFCCCQSRVCHAIASPPAPDWDCLLPSLGRACPTSNELLATCYLLLCSAQADSPEEADSWPLETHVCRHNKLCMPRTIISASCHLGG